MPTEISDLLAEFFMTEEEVADLLRVSKHAVRKWRAEGKLGFVKINQTIRIPKSEVADFISRNRKNPICHDPNCPSRHPVAV